MTKQKGCGKFFIIEHKEYDEQWCCGREYAKGEMELCPSCQQKQEQNK